MAENSKIEWTDATWNPIRGCSRISAGCTNCYAESVAHRFSGPGMPYEGMTKHGRWNGTVRVIEKHLRDPIRWRKPRRIFVNSMSDLFHESLTFDQIDQVYGAMAAAPRHVYQVLTKRSSRMRDYTREDRRERWAAVAASLCDGGDKMYDAIRNGPRVLSQVWHGVSVEDARVIHRVVDLLNADSEIRFLSCEPLIGAIPQLPLSMIRDVDITHVSTPGGIAGWSGHIREISWVIVGGESGRDARLCDGEWIRDIIQQCRRADVAVFVKQLGAHYVDSIHGVMGRSTNAPNKSVPALRRLKHAKGGDIDEWPPGLGHRQFPSTI